MTPGSSSSSSSSSITTSATRDCHASVSHAYQRSRLFLLSVMGASSHRTLLSWTVSRLVTLAVATLVLVTLWRGTSRGTNSQTGSSEVVRQYPVSIVYDKDNNRHEYDSRTHPFIFIGGHPRSGTTLMRALLDAHPWVRCGEETRMVPRIVQMKENWYRSENELMRLRQAGVDDFVVDSAVGAFILETIVKHGTPAKVLCNKDPLTLKSGGYMSRLFPKSKWLFMMRDGRAAIHSVLSRKVTITGYDLEDPRQCLGRWNGVVEKMKNECDEIGPTRCMIVYYEQLVLHPRRWMEMILDFLDIPWNESVMHHQDFINKGGESGIRVSMKERSSDQIIKPINLEALTQWVGTYPDDVVKEMAEIAPMLTKFGYDPYQNPPKYGVPDSEVANNTKDVQENKDFWEVKAKELVAKMEKLH